MATKYTPFTTGFTDEQLAALRQIVTYEVSIAEHIRRAVDIYLSQPQNMEILQAPRAAASE